MRVTRAKFLRCLEGRTFFFFFFFSFLHQKNFFLCSCDADQQFISHRKSGFYIRNLSWNGSKINRVESSEWITMSWSQSKFWIFQLSYRPVNNTFHSWLKENQQTGRYSVFSLRLLSSMTLSCSTQISLSCWFLHSRRNSERLSLKKKPL